MKVRRTWANLNHYKMSSRGRTYKKSKLEPLADSTSRAPPMSLVEAICSNKVYPFCYLSLCGRSSWFCFNL